jgi:hypothetical protein
MAFSIEKKANKINVPSPHNKKSGKENTDNKEYPCHAIFLGKCFTNASHKNIDKIHIKKKPDIIMASQKFEVQYSLEKSSLFFLQYLNGLVI